MTKIPKPRTIEEALEACDPLIKEFWVCHVGPIVAREKAVTLRDVAKAGEEMEGLSLERCAFDFCVGLSKFSGLFSTEDFDEFIAMFVKGFVSGQAVLGHATE